MPRRARIVFPGIPHHVLQRGNRRQQVFFEDSDYRAYIQLLNEEVSKSGVEILAWCLMPNHVHIIAVPEHKDSLARVFGETHKRYSKMINSRFGWSGHLWQARFGAFAMDDAWLYRCIRYVELNPVKAGLCRSAADWPWSSARHHLDGRRDFLCRPNSQNGFIPDWHAYLQNIETETDSLTAHMTSSLPLGDEGFIQALENVAGRRLRKLKPGPKTCPN